jgi:histidine ammonia-lyase
MALINGSPCAAALVADVALAGRRRIELAEATLALVAEAAGAPDEHYAPELEQLWGDEHEAAALRSMRGLLEGSARERQAHQASVSLRILPRVLGGARRAQAEAERAARVSLSSVTDNPVYLPPTPQRPMVRCAPPADITTLSHARHGRAGLRTGRPLPIGAAFD